MVFKSILKIRLNWLQLTSLITNISHIHDYCIFNYFVSNKICFVNFIAF